MLGAFVYGDGIDLFAGDHVGQPAGFDVVATVLQCRCSEHGRGQEGRRRQIAADLFEHDPGFDMAHVEPAVIFAHQNAGEAHFGELLPQFVAETVLAIAIAPMAQLFLDAALFGHELFGGFGKHRLIFVVIKGHNSAFYIVIPVQTGIGCGHVGRCRQRPGLRRGDAIEKKSQAPGRSRMRFEMTFSITSLVPPSMLFALVRSQLRAVLPPLVSSLSHSRARLPPAAISNS